MKTLQVGNKYKTQAGNTVTITRLRNSEEYPYAGLCREIGPSELSFTKDGKFLSYATNECDLIIPNEPDQTTELTTESNKEEPKVEHLEVILAIVQKIPVQYDYMLTGTWHDYNYTSDDLSPVNYPEYNWRIKPQLEPKRTVVIGKRTVVAPEISILHWGSEYFYIDKSQGSISKGIWSEHIVDKKRLEMGNIFMLEQDAINCQEAISALLLGKD